MFKLQRLEITGFKSFADHTELVFTGDGITAVVGPNGCGKSNVADAIAWVLGEQRIKHLRGGEMKDVIFQGSRNRAPSGMAEVVLHMMRDETSEHEPDIEDIDSTLEGIDEHNIEVEQRLAPELLLEANGPTPDAPVDSNASEPSSDATSEPVIANAVEITATETTAPIESEASASLELKASAHLEAEAGALVAAELVTTTALAPLEVEVIAPKQQAKRHWRPSRRALDFAPGEVVTVTRRLYRSGESEYLLNNRMCRLRDIQDLFSGTGLSGAHYAIVEQGRIGQILSAKPMDRRTLIEEAAGITKFRVRQRAAETRLESARSNLSRISDIISEIDRQVNSLRRQAAKARRYRVLREELRELLRRVYVAEEHTLSALLQETGVRLEEVSQEERALIEELATREDDARTATQDARAIEEELSEARAAAAEAALQRDRRARERTYQEEQVITLEKRRADVEAEMLSLRERLQSVAEECESLRRKDSTLRTESEQSALVLQSAEAAYGQKLLEASAAEAAIESARAELLTHTAVAERLMEIGRQLESAIERLALQAEGLAHEGERAAAIHAERITEAESLNQEIVAAREQLKKLMAEREAAVHTVVAGHEAVSETDAELTRVRDEFSRARHRLDSLLELDTRRAHYSSAVQRIFADTEAMEEFHFMGTLADMLNVEPQWERAVEGVFGSSLQAIIVPTPDDAARAAAWLREHNAGRASFLVAGLHGASDEADTALTYSSAPADSSAESSGAFESLDSLRLGDLLGASRELRAVLNRTLTQRMNARLAASLDDAISKSLATGEMYVTRSGDWVAGGQLVNAGDERALEEGAGLLGFKRELRELESRAAELSLELDEATRAATEARSRLTELEDAVVLLNEVIGREERDAMTRELTATQLTQEIERAERHLRVVADDAARLAQERLELEERRATALSEAATAEAARTASAEMVAQAAVALTLARRNAEVENEGLGEQRAAAAAAAERRRATAAELRRMEAEQSDLDARLERYEREFNEVTLRLEELQRSIGEIEQGAFDIAAAQAREQQTLNEMAMRLTSAREKADALSDELAELNRLAAAAREARAGLDIQRAEAAARLSYIREACLAELNHSLEELAREAAVEEDFELEAARAHVEEMRARIEGFGAVNMMALEELAEAEERFQFLTGQRLDITEGIASTEEALREIKRRSRERFRQAFEEINRNFSQFFQELFGGGRGEMSMIDADDVLESGIDIIAQPPGKRLQNVLLLSGGEKAMAALALVLGIFHYRPSPFCLLDEVDAPLDEANVGRFTDKVAEMSVNTQFIVITHNKRTMEMARALYGVTMEEAGISKLVSVKFE